MSGIEVMGSALLLRRGDADDDKDVDADETLDGPGERGGLDMAGEVWLTSRPGGRRPVLRAHLVTTIGKPRRRTRHPARPVGPRRTLPTGECWPAMTFKGDSLSPILRLAWLQRMP